MTLERGTRLVGVLLVGLSLGACVTNNIGGDDTDDDTDDATGASSCTDVCEHMIDDCDAVTPSGEPTPMGDCVALCEEEFTAGQRACLANAACSVSSMQACLMVGGPPGNSGGCGECNEADDCLHTCECVGGVITAGECDSGCCGGKSDVCSASCSEFGGWTGN